MLTVAVVEQRERDAGLGIAGREGGLVDDVVAEREDLRIGHIPACAASRTICSIICAYPVGVHAVDEITRLGFGRHDQRRVRIIGVFQPRDTIYPRQNIGLNTCSSHSDKGPIVSIRKPIACPVTLLTLIHTPSLFQNSNDPSRRRRPPPNLFPLLGRMSSIRQSSLPDSL